MKIWLTGAQGTGKTTVLNLFKEPEAITEVVRNMAKEGMTINRDSGIATQREIFNCYRRLFNSKSDYISDRGLTDVLAYSCVGEEEKPDCSDAFTWGEEINREIHIMLDYIKENQSDLAIIYFPIEFPVEDDGFRCTDEAYRKEVDRTIKHILDTYIDIDYLTVHGTPEERYSQIMNYIR